LEEAEVMGHPVELYGFAMGDGGPE
jgi:hypothetical protein